jgi:hypothetical protein
VKGGYGVERHIQQYFSYILAVGENITQSANSCFKVLFLIALFCYIFVVISIDVFVSAIPW